MFASDEVEGVAMGEMGAVAPVNSYGVPMVTQLPSGYQDVMMSLMQGTLQHSANPSPTKVTSIYGPPVVQSPPGYVSPYPISVTPQPGKATRKDKQACYQACRKQCDSPTPAKQCTKADLECQHGPIVKRWQSKDACNTVANTQYQDGYVERRTTAMLCSPCNPVYPGSNASTGAPFDAAQEARYQECISSGGTVESDDPNMPGGSSRCYPKGCPRPKLGQPIPYGGVYNPNDYLMGLEGGGGHHHGGGYRSRSWGYQQPPWDYFGYGAYPVPVILTEDQVKQATQCGELDLECKKREVAKLEKLKKGMSGLGVISPVAGMSLTTVALLAAAAYFGYKAMKNA
jgi:hypothetical protein